MLNRLKSLWCEAFHEGAINITVDSYQCPSCQRLISHNLGNSTGCNNYSAKKVASDGPVSLAKFPTQR